jgi:hypothetical protein
MEHLGRIMLMGDDATPREVSAGRPELELAWPVDADDN